MRILIVLLFWVCLAADSVSGAIDRWATPRRHRPCRCERAWGPSPHHHHDGPGEG